MAISMKKGNSNGNTLAHWDTMAIPHATCGIKLRSIVEPESSETELDLTGRELFPQAIDGIGMMLSLGKLEKLIKAAKEGAKLVINDLGGSVAGGDEGDKGPIELVKKEIISVLFLANTKLGFWC